MPSLKDLNCAIELSESHQALQEFGTIYDDGFVETFIPVPSKPQSFSIHLTSNRFIAPGIAIFVYVDGVYQCNRNRQDLKLRKPSDSRSLIDFRVRQKEERQSDGSMIAREWAFDKLNIASADDAPNLCSPDILQNIGCIEVVVLRCAGTRNAKSASTMNFDGAGDYPDRRYYDLDDTSSPSNERSMYDDRGPFITTSGNGHGPPPPISSYRSPYAESLRSQEGSASKSHRTTHITHELFPPASAARHSRPHSKYFEPISPGAQRTDNLPPSGFQYGSGPIPRDGETYNNHLSNPGATQPPAVDPIWLNNLLTTAVKQGVEESRRLDTQPEGPASYKRITRDTNSVSQPPGAWPESPLDALTQPHYQQSSQPAFSSRDQHTDHSSNWKQSQTGWCDGKAQSRAGTRVTWNNEPVEETVAGEWHMREETASDSWDTGDTWPTDRMAEWEAGSQRGEAWMTKTPSHYNAVPGSPINLRSQERGSSKQDLRRESRSKSRSRRSRRRYDVTSSEEEKESGDWNYIKRPSDSIVSLSSSSEATIQPSHSRSQIQTLRRRSKSRSRRSKSMQHEHERRASRHSRRTPTWEAADVVPVPAPSLVARLTPTVMNAPTSTTTPVRVRSRQPSACTAPPASVLPSWNSPIPALPIQEHLRRPSAYAAPPASVVPASYWASQVHDAMCKPSIATSTFVPAPYAPSLKDFVQSIKGEIRGRRSSSSSSWGDGREDGAVQVFWGKLTEQDTGWSKKSDSGWQDKTPKENNKNGWYSTDKDETGGWTNDNDDQKAKDDDGWNSKNTCQDTAPSPTTQNKDENPSAFAGVKSVLKSALQNPPPATEVPWQSQSWSIPPNNNNNAAKPSIQHSKPTPSPTAAPVPAPAPSISKQSQRMSNKSLSQYRSNHPSFAPASSLNGQRERIDSKSFAGYRPNHPSLDTSPNPAAAARNQPTWQFPPRPSLPRPTNPLSSNNNLSIAPAPPRLAISRKLSIAKGIEHAVRPGKAMSYGHVVGRPEYLDGLEKPYAVFRFKYRSVRVLNELFGELGELERKGEGDDGDEKTKAKEVLKKVPQEELIAKMLDLERQLKIKEGGGSTGTGTGTADALGHGNSIVDKQKDEAEEKQRRSSAQTGGATRTFTEQWVERHSRDPSVLAAKSLGREESKRQENERKQKEAGETLREGGVKWRLV